MIEKQRTNVLFLTTKCNLKCDYCYEGSSRSKLESQRDLRKEDVDIFLDEIAVREKGAVSTLVIMGGEPFLKYDLLTYAINRAWEMDHQFGVSVTTNGTMLNKKFSGLISSSSLFELKQLVSKISTLEVSWDGSGHHRRKFNDGVSSKAMVRKALWILGKNEIPFRISYTVHKDNYENLLYDMVYIMTQFKPKQVKLSFACQELHDISVDYVEFKQNFLEYAEYLYMSYGIPICDLNCKKCQLCDKSNFIGNSYMSPTTGLTYEEKHVEKKFDSF